MIQFISTPDGPAFMRNGRTWLNYMTFAELPHGEPFYLPELRPTGIPGDIILLKPYLPDYPHAEFFVMRAGFGNFRHIRHYAGQLWATRDDYKLLEWNYELPEARRRFPVVHA